MKNDFISSVSHELRTPLTAIKGWAETLQTGGIGRETYDKGMNVIVREAERLSGMVEELLDFSRMQSGRMRLILKKIDLLAELDEAVYMFTDRARTEHKNLIYDEEDTMLSPILGDVNRLRQVFINVIDNALKYTNPGGTVRVSAYEDDGFIRVIIKTVAAASRRSICQMSKRSSTKQTKMCAATASASPSQMRSWSCTPARLILTAKKAWAPRSSSRYRP